jgi:putative ABC transport system substrate-binding protein
MNRRDLITLIGGAAVWPVAARAQQPAIPVIGFLDNRTRSDGDSALPGFRQGLRETNFIEGENVITSNDGRKIKTINYR